MGLHSLLQANIIKVCLFVRTRLLFIYIITMIQVPLEVAQFWMPPNMTGGQSRSPVIDAKQDLQLSCEFGYRNTLIPIPNHWFTARVQILQNKTSRSDLSLSLPIRMDYNDACLFYPSQSCPNSLVQAADRKAVWAGRVNSMPSVSTNSYRANLGNEGVLMNYSHRLPYKCTTDPGIYKHQMARTKQTARMSTAQKVPRKALLAQTLARKSSTFKAATVAIEADEEAPIGFSQFSLKFDDQKKCEAKAIEAQIVRCSNCEAVLTYQSKLLSPAEYKHRKEDQIKDGCVADEVNAKYLTTKNPVWICQFCCQHNEVSNKYHVPKEENPCFVLSKSKSRSKSKKGTGNETDKSQEQLLIFCIDVSPSMGNSVANGTTRLECVREAVRDQINKMNMERSQRVVGLITFGSEITIFNSKGKSTKIDQTNYQDFEKIAMQAAGYPVNSWGPISANFKSMSKVLNELPTSYGTAIGPALVVAIEIASKGPTGSRVIMCTDGEANIGIGCYGKDDPFYSKVGQYAKDKGVSVSVLGIKGVDVNLKCLGKVTHATGGTVMKVDPMKIGTEFSKIVNEQILGSNAELTVRLNSRFIFSNVDKNLLSKKNTLMKQKLGNFGTDSELTFQFQTLTLEQARDQLHINLQIFRNERLPMQVQLQYVSVDGSQYLQIVTDWRELSDGDKDKDMEAEVDLGVFVVNAFQKISKFISEGNYDKAGSFYKQVQASLKKNVPRTKQEKQEAQEHFKRLQTLKSILQRRSNKKGVRIFKDESQSQAEDDNSDSQDDDDGRPARKRKLRTDKRSRSRSRDRGAVIKGKSRRSPAKATKGRKASSKGQKLVSNMSSSEEEVVLYREMRATRTKGSN